MLHSGYPKQTSGTHEISVNTGRLAPGIYYYRLQTEPRQGCGKILVIK